MINTTIFLIFLVLCILSFEFFSKTNNKNSEFMSFAHADIYRGIATLIIILQHVSGLYGTRLFTPLGGIGVAIFLISSGYGLNESYKKLGDINLLKYTQKYWKSKLFRVFYHMRFLLL
ncbi:MAG: hypothetical protein R3Y35_12910 [Clostridia bacterium]